MKATARTAVVPTLALLFLVIVAGSPLVAQPVPIAYYPFSGSATDASGNGHHGSVVGARASTDRFGNPSSAYTFDGDDFIEVPHAARLTFGPTSAFTINAWVRVCQPLNSFSGIVAKGPSGTHYPGYQFFVYNDAVGGETGLGSGSFVRVSGSTPLSDGRWHMLTMMVSGPNGTIAVYRDGVLEATTTSGDIDPSLGYTAPMFIGKERNSDVFFTGAIDDVGIFNRALTTNELAVLFAMNGWTGSSSSPDTLTLRSLDGTTICRGDSVRLEAGGGVGFEWSPTTGLSAATGGRVVARPQQTTTYTVRGAPGPAGCGTPTPKSITIEVKGPLVDAGVSRAVCVGTTVTIGAPATEGLPPYSYRWSPSDGLSDATIATPTVTVDTTRTYTVTVADESGCSHTDSVRIEARPLPELALSDTSYCRGSAGVVIGARAGGGTGPMQYRWSPATGLSSELVAQPIARPDSTTRYEVTVTDAAGCSTTASVLVTVYPQITHDAGPDVVICLNDTTTIGRDIVPGRRITWTPSTGLSDPTVARPSASPEYTTVYRATVVDSLGGCVALDSVTVTVLRTSIEVGGATDYGLHLPQLEVDNDHTITNTSSMPIRIDSIAIDPPFEILSTSRGIPTTLAPGEVMTVRVRYTAEPGVQTRTLRAYVGSPCFAEAGLELKASGDDRALAVVRVEDFSGPAGATLRMRLVLDSAVALDRAGASLFSATVAFDRTLLYPVDRRSMRMDSLLRRITIEGVWIGTTRVLAEVDMTAMLGHADSTPLLLESFEWITPKSPIPTRTIDGVFRLDSVCEDGGKRLIEPGIRTLLRPITPHPVHASARVVMQLEERGPMRLSIVDQLGTEVLRILDEEAGPGTHEVVVDVGALAAGAYLLVLRTPTRVVTSPLEVVR